MKNYYATLGVPQNATRRQIREAFLELARDRHPDRFHGNEKEQAELAFQELTQAFNELNDPVRRRELDAGLARRAVAGEEHSAQAARVYLQRGVVAYKEKSYGEAVENFDRATQEDPENAKTWHYLAVAGRLIPSWKARARSAAAKACELEPMNATYLRLAGNLHAEAQEYTQAAKYLRQALDWGDDDPETRKAFEQALKAAKRVS